MEKRKDRTEDSDMWMWKRMKKIKQNTSGYNYKRKVDWTGHLIEKKEFNVPSHVYYSSVEWYSVMWNLLPRVFK